MMRGLGAALRRRDAGAVTGMLHDEVSLVVDGGVSGVAPGEVRGAAEAGAALLSMTAGAVLRPVRANGADALAIVESGRVVAVLCGEARGDALTSLWAIGNPDKLHPWNRPGVTLTGLDLS